MDQPLQTTNMASMVRVELLKAATNRRLATVEMSQVPRIGEIVWIETRSMALMVEDVIWNAEGNSVQLYLGPDRNRLDR